MPTSLRQATATGMAKLTPQRVQSAMKTLSPVLPKKLKQRHAGDKFVKLAECVRAKDSDEVFQSLVSQWKSPQDLVINSREPLVPLTDRANWVELSDFTERMMFLDTISYLSDDILVKVDRASMGTSLEAREPLLDHRLLEFAWRLPLNMKIRDGEGKWLLRQVLYRYVPQSLIDRPKMGFGIPIDSWLRGPLRDWAENLLSESNLEANGLLNSAPIRKKWAEHLSGRYNWQYYLWNVLIFQSWLEQQ